MEQTTYSQELELANENPERQLVQTVGVEHYKQLLIVVHLLMHLVPSVDKSLPWAHLVHREGLLQEIQSTIEVPQV